MSLKLAVIGTFHGRHDSTLPLLRRVLVESTRRPDEFWIMCEDEDDYGTALKALELLANERSIMQEATIDYFRLQILPTPRRENGSYEIVPYSAKINWALDRTEADVIAYLDNSSMPGVEKYQQMVYGMACNPDWGGCYVTQERTGFAPAIYEADKIVPNGHCQLNYTAICHKRTADRWSTNMAHANPDLVDAMFMADLSKSVGPLHPVGGAEVHDWHHIASPAAAGI